jgi:hypothetical protein
MLVIGENVSVQAASVVADISYSEESRKSN